VGDELIPLVDLALQHAEIADEVALGFAAVIEHGAYVLGPEVERFEEAFAAHCGVKQCVGVANGTDALEMALRAVGVGPGDEVVLPTNTFVATAEAVTRIGAVPILVDCDPDFLLIDVDGARGRMGPRTAAVIPVHLFGQLAPVEELVPAAASVGAAIVEDAAQCQGARRFGRGPAAVSGLGATSFYPGKNLGAYGDAGAVIANDGAVVESVRRLRNHGETARYQHSTVGFNSRMDTMQAVVLLAKLRRLDGWNEQRRQAATRYHELLADIDAVARPGTLPGNEHVWHLYVVRVPERDDLLRRLRAAGIGAGIHYPTPVHLLAPFAHLGHGRGSFPVAESAAAEILSLPIYPGITASQQERIVDVLRRALR